LERKMAKRFITMEMRINEAINKRNLHDWLQSLTSHETFGYGGVEESISISIWFETLIRLKDYLKFLPYPLGGIQK
jgi:hypothetical protein